MVDADSRRRGVGAVLFRLAKLVASMVAPVLLGCDSSVTGVMSPLQPVPPVTGAAGASASAPPAGSDGSPEALPPMLPLAGGGDEQSVAPLENFCPDVPNVCLPVRSSEPLPGRVLPEIQTVVTRTFTAADVYDAFEAACGRCHKGTPSQNRNGNFVLDGPQQMLDDPEERVGQPAIDRLLETDPKLVMPPARGAATGVEPLRADDQALLDLLDGWLKAGRAPRGYSTEKAAEPPFLREESIRTHLTNIGNCIPEPALVGCARLEMQALDAEFAALRSFADLPKRLDETDLFTFDAATLAQQAVLPYAPTYTLFSDNAKKMRHVRVPLGQTIHYDAARNDFVIPANTRFYKTFLRDVVDREGNHAYRKVETRIIVVRPDVVVAGVATRQVIFGTYLWSADESRAELVEAPYSDQTPFRDLPLRHVTDEARAIGSGIDPDTEAGVLQALQIDDELRVASPHAELGPADLLTRGYALPGRDRCIQCHMGSSSYTGDDSRSFILGFNPYQVDRRRKGEGGVFDQLDVPIGADELSQLRRFVAYGIIDGVELPPEDFGAQAAPAFQLEESQELPPRNGYELKAQGYMLGNCAFCHNPQGFPSVENPSLKDVLNFFPDAASDGGIFHFPLERFSPRTARGDNFGARFPYITPSLFERSVSSAVSRAVTKSFEFGPTTVFVVGPWRSLVYRNTHTPFTYGHDQAIHPHMPLNVPGYDARASTILGDWMLSIPARLKRAVPNPGDPGQPLRAAAENSEEFAGEPPSADDPVGSEQPWEEVSAGDPLFSAYQQAAELRVQAFHLARILPYEEYASSCPPEVAQDCEDAISLPHAYIGSTAFRPDDSDAVAPEMRLPPRLEQPYDEPFWVVPGASAGPDTSAASLVARIVRDRNDLSAADRALQGAAFLDVVPDRASWIARDLTTRPGAWVPRRPQWPAIFASEEAFLPPPVDLSDLPADQIEKQRSEHEALRTKARRVFRLLSRFEVSGELRDFALSRREEFPFGLWQDPPLGAANPAEATRCEALLGAGSRPKRVRDLQGDPPSWFAEPPQRPAGEELDRLVYVQPPGEILFNLICSNCHGSEANANSLLASTMLELTGGRTRVANLRDGLFGGAGENRDLVFPSEQYAHESAETMAVRYLLWMGLGGTEATIPQVVLNRVGATRPLGVERGANPHAQPTANMLSNAIGFCQDSIGFDLDFDQERRTPRFDAFKPGPLHAESPLVATNGDANLWLTLCAIDNSPPIRVVSLVAPKRSLAETSRFRFRVTGAYWRDLDGTALLPPDAAFGDQRGRVVHGLRPDNLLPWCVRKPASAAEVAELEAEWQRDPDDVANTGPRLNLELRPPYCPEQLFTGPDGVDWLQLLDLKAEDERRDAWATRGAMNVGASVYLYLDALSRGELTRKPPHDACALPKDGR